MGKITKLDDITIYKEALRLAHLVYQLAKYHPLVREYALLDQLKRSGLSVAANIAEGYGRKTKKDFCQFLSIALGSVNEAITYLDFINLEFKINTTNLKEEYITLSRRIYSFRTYLSKPI